jgi:hypothetical protein
VVLGSCNYINIPCGLFWGGSWVLLLLLLHSLSRCSGFTCSYSITVTPFSLFHFWSLILANSCALGLSMEKMVGRGEPFLDGCNKLLIILGGNVCLCA